MKELNYILIIFIAILIYLIFRRKLNFDPDLISVEPPAVLIEPEPEPIPEPEPEPPANGPIFEMTQELFEIAEVPEEVILTAPTPYTDTYPPSTRLFLNNKVFYLSNYSALITRNIDLMDYNSIGNSSLYAVESLTFDSKGRLWGVCGAGFCPAGMTQLNPDTAATLGVRSAANKNYFWREMLGGPDEKIYTIIGSTTLQLLYFDLSTNTTTNLGVIGYSDGTPINGMEWLNGEMYVLTEGGRLFKIPDITDLATTVYIGNISQQYEENLVYVDGKMYFFGYGVGQWEVDPNTAAKTQVSTSGNFMGGTNFISSVRDFSYNVVLTTFTSLPCDISCDQLTVIEFRDPLFAYDHAIVQAGGSFTVDANYDVINPLDVTFNPLVY